MRATLTVMEIYLTRHTSVAVAPGTCYGATDVPLAASFAEEAAVVRDRLAGIAFDEVWSSPSTRALRLARFCGFPDPKRDDRLKELDFGAWEMRRYDEIDDPRLQEWYDDYLHVRATGGESFEEQYRRVASFLDRLRRQPLRRVALFTHGGVLRCARIHAGLCRFEEAFSESFAYGETIRIDLDPR